MIDKQKFEAAREFQIAMEHDRRARDEFGDVLSMEDELAEVGDTLAHHRRGLFEAFFGWLR